MLGTVQSSNVARPCRHQRVRFHAPNTRVIQLPPLPGDDPPEVYEGGEGAPRQDEIWRCGQRLSGDSDEMRDAPIRSRREDAECGGPAAAMRARAGPLGVQTARADTDA